MRFDDHFLEELKTRLRPSEVIGKSVKLRKNGREWVGLSPFSKEKTPSFYVNDEKRFFHDFSSGKHGDIISFLQETERLSFNEAVEKLAAEAGMALPVDTPQAKAAEMKRRGLTDWMDLAQKWFVSRLQDKTPAAQNARDYLERRGLSKEDIVTFGLGYAPRDRTALKDALVQRGAKVSELVECGLLIEIEGGSAPYDRFRDRLMFPIEDQRGIVVSFGGRALNPDDKAKYLNGPETTLFHKGQMLFGLPKALKLLGAQETHAELVVVEGYMDVIACQRAHVAAVAPLGTALTEEQIEILWRRHPEPTLCFDGDKAGQRAASRALDRALPKLKPGRSFKVCLITGGKDPDDVLREKGALALREALKETRPFVEVLFSREAEAEPLDTPERKAGFKKRLRALAAQIEDKDLAEAYRQDLLERYDALVAPQRQAGFQGKAPFVPNQGAAPRKAWQPGQKREIYIPPAMEETRRAAVNLSSALDPTAASLAQGLVDNPDWMLDQVEGLEAYGFGDDALAPLAKALIALSFQHEGLDRPALSRHLQKQGLGALLSEIQKAALKSGAPFLSPDISSADAHARWLQAFNAVSRLTALDRALNSAREQVGTEFFSRLKLERDALRKSLRSGQIWQDGDESPT
ncbi:DNA primase [Asticcacaulis taihuensis]|uniref:DNA primase n=1 Tax=Asticcacaulis taihuensis TaxID=260084 RepID=A0A1G4TBB1_9CAUL|nr:DNA primase [Asticcacaulis taihuensis]SCW78724.1 DNA primase [Asticcacaulis taihuensis]